METFTDFMLRAGVLKFGDFTLKSGRRSPYFLNAGMYREGEHLATLGEYYAKLIAASDEEFDALFGPAYKGIPLAAVTALTLWRDYGRSYPFFYNRKEAKTHGEGGALVGYEPKRGDKIAVIEDVVSAGTAVRESVDIIGAAGARVTALYVTVDRMERGLGELSALDELRENFGINVYPIITVRDIMETLPVGDARRAAMEGYLLQYGVSV